MRTSITALLGKTAVAAIALSAVPSFASEDAKLKTVSTQINSTAHALTHAIIVNDITATNTQKSAASENDIIVAAGVQSTTAQFDVGQANQTKVALAQTIPADGTPAQPAPLDPPVAPAASNFTITGNGTLTTDYRFRGIGFSDGDFAIQGGLNLNHSSGFYVGIWGSSIEDSATFGNSEVDLFGGWSGNISSAISANVGLLYFYFPNGDNGAAGPSDFFEPFGSLSSTLGPAQLTVGFNYAWSQAAIGNDDNLYLYTNLSVGVPNTPITLNANYGYNTGSVSLAPDRDQSDFLLGASYVVTNNLTATLSYIASDTDLPSSDGFTDDTLVFSLGLSF